MSEGHKKVAFTSRSLPGGVRIEIPTARNWFVLIFLPFWLFGWVLGEAVLVWKVLLLAKAGGGLDLAIGSWLVGWTLAGVVAWVIFFWFLVGKEVIEVSSSTLTLSQRIGSFARTKVLDPDRVGGLRVSPLDPEGDSPLSSFAIRGYGMIVFEYDSKTHRFGALSDPVDARRVCEEMARWLPPRAAVSNDP